MDINEPIKRDRNLNITVIADDSRVGRVAVDHGVMLAEVFQASLTVMANFGFGFGLPESRHIPDNSLLLKDIRAAVSEVANYQVITDYIFPETLFKYAEDHNTAMFVIGVAHFMEDRAECFFSVKKALKFIRQSRFPVMTVTAYLENVTDYKNILLTLDIERQNKEKALWAGYFSRFYGSVIHILYPEYKDEGLAKLVRDNVDFVEKLYENLEISYDKYPVSSQGYLDAYALTDTHESGALVIMMTRYYTLADILTGPRERKIIGKTGMPVLCINQRDDLYVLCT
ncbi:MAG: universal stress protein [Bacteroidales bacterium]|nr:universal stress protein [Bacteroidales bacterium]